MSGERERLNEKLLAAAWRLYWNVTDDKGRRYLPDPTSLKMLRRELDAAQALSKHE